MESKDHNGSLSKLNGKNVTVQDGSAAEQEPFLPAVAVTPKKEGLETEAPVPLDRFNLVYIIMVIHGIGTLMPWNMFINANAYFVEYKLCGDNVSDSYKKYFLSSLGFVAQIPNVALNLINIFCQCGGGGNLAIRITVSIIIVVAMFIITVILAMLDSSTWAAAFFWFTMITVVIINMANGVYQNSIYGTAACLPMKYTNAVVLGSNTSGAITSVLNILSIWMAPDPRTAAIYYFLAAILVLLLAFDMYYVLPLSAFYRHYKEKASKDTAVSSQETVSTRPPFFEIFKKCYVQHLSVWFVFFVTLTCFPAIQAGIKKSSPSFPLNDKYYTPVTCFLFFNVFAVVGNIVADFIKVPGPKFVWLPILLRGLFIPFFMFCNFNPLTRNMPVLFANDYVYALTGIVMAFTSGYFSSLGMMYAPGCVEDKHKGTAGMMAAFFLIFGIFSGICFSFFTIFLIENVPPGVDGVMSNFTMGNFTEAPNSTCYIAGS